MNKQIEEMIKAFDDYCNNEVPDDVCARTRCIDCHAKSLIKAGYRKASEIFAEIENLLGGLLRDYNRASRFSDADVIRYATQYLVSELRKKYESEGGE